MLTLNSKLPNVGTTIFSVMSAMAARHDAINLSQGFPDFEPPQLLRDRVSHHLNAGHNQYAPMHGVQSLREQIAEQLARRYDVQVDANAEVTVTSGATEALLSTIAALVGPGDEVVVFDPAYDSYAPAVELVGGKCVHVPLTPGEFAIDFERLQSVLNSRSRLLILNSPHNPTGSVLASTDLARLGAMLEPLDCYVLSDEVYEHIVFDGAAHCSVLASPSLANRSVAVFSFGKTYHATGWKVGYCVANASLTAEIRKVHQYNTFATASVLQWALADFMAAEPDYFTGISAFYQAKRDKFCELLVATPFNVRPSSGTYFQLADYSQISDDDDVAFSEWLTKEIGVATIPVSVFYDRPDRQRLIRFCFAKEDHTLELAAERLCAI